MIAVVLPTIAGREALLERTIRAYRQHTDDEVAVIVIRDRPTIGAAWNDGAQAAVYQTDAYYLHLSADDVEPHPGWDTAAIGAVDRGVYPSPRILNADGSLHSCGTMGGGMLLPECGDGTPCASSPFPFMRTDDWPHVGPSIDAHYYADDYLGWAARRAGMDVEVVRGFALTHLEGTVGRAGSVQRSARDRQAFLAAVAVESPAPAEVLA